MQKKVVLGMVALAVTMSFSNAFAANTARSSEMLADYSKQIKEVAFGKGLTAKGLTSQQAKIAQDKLINNLELPAGKNNALTLSLKGDSDKASQRLDHLATIVAAKKMAATIAKTDATEGQSLESAANASAKLIANSSLVGARKVGKDLNAQEMAEVTDALTKLESLPETILTRFSTLERDSYTQILERHDQLIDSGAKGSAEEAFIQAIMDVKKIDRTKALEVARKLKECV